MTRAIAAAALALAAACALAAEPRFGEIVLSDTFGGSAKDVFKPGTQWLHLRAKLADVPARTLLRCEWIAVPSERKMDSMGQTLGSMIDSARFTVFSANWPEGDYRADLFIANRPAGTVSFKVAR